MRATSELSRPSRRSAPSAWRRTGGWLLPVLAAAIIFAPPFAPTAEAQTTLVSNVGQTRSGSLGLDTYEGAQAFTTGDNSAGYTVTSVGLDMSSGADRTTNFTVGIWTNSNSNLPGSSLVTLMQPASLILGVNEFTTSGIELAANTTYWVVVDSTSGGSVQWEGTASDSEDSTASGWSIADESYDRPYDGDTWGSWTDPFKLRVNGTAIGIITNNAPVFTEGTSTTRSVAENTASGQNIGALVTATDTDTSDTLNYTLGGTDAADFGIVSSSGQLQTSAALDYETKDSYAVTVSVSDGNGGADSINVTINVTDVDEPNSAPVFTEGTSTTRSVAENTASGQNIGALVTATDTDTSDTLTYTLGGMDAAAFGIVRSSGQLQTSAALNFETKASYAVTVSVSDGNGGAASINVTINVTDVDEPNSAPVFTEGTTTTRSVAENTASGQNIGAAVTATDADTTDTLTYTLGGTDAAAFGIVRSSGQLQTSAALNFETKASYAVTVSVSDGNGGTDSINVTINVTADRAALVALYNATDGANWTYNTNWLTDQALSEWYGVETDEDGRVRELNLNANKLSREIPAALGRLTNLEYLYLAVNTLSGTIPEELGRLTNLKLLHLNSNELSGEIPEELGDLTNLQGLYLHRNELSGAIPVELGSLTNLEELVLSENELSGEITAQLGNLTNLQELWLSHNELSGTIRAELGDLTNLQGLYLSVNTLSGEIPAQLGDLTNLQKLSLSTNNLSGEIPVELGRLTNLQYLWLHTNELSGEIPVELGDLTDLQYLYLNKNELSGEIPAALGNLINLEELHLNENELSGKIPAELGDLTSLQELYLNKNGLSEEIPVELGNLTNLEELALSRNTLSGEIPAALGRLTNLQYLYLHRNNLSGKIPAELGDLTSLQHLWLHRNKLSGEIPAELGNLTNLQLLYLNDNELTGTIPTALANLAQLQEFDISNTGLCAPSGAAFQAWLATINFQGAVCATRPPGGGGGGGGGGGPRTSAPGSPRNLTAASGNGEVVLTWEAPASDGGAAITDYEYRIDRRNPWISIGSTDTTHTVSGLVNGTEYVFEVRAVNRIGKSFSSNRAEATPEAPEVFTLDFAHFANGTSITSDLVLVNVAPQPVRPAIYFYDTEGAPIAAESLVDLTGDLEIQEDGSLSVSTEMDPLGVLTISTHGRGSLVTGSVKVVSEGLSIGGGLRYNLPAIGEAVVGASPPVGDALFPVRRQEGGINTGVAIHNLGEEAMEARCELMREGVLRDAASIPLEANGQTSWVIDQAFPAADTSDFTGSVRCAAVGQGLFSAVALEMDPGTRIFTILPLFPVDRRGGGREAALDFAHFVNGTWITDLVFVNLSTEASRPAPTPFHTAIPPSRPAIYFYDTEGDLIAPDSVVDVTGDLEITEDGALTVQTEMEPLGVLTISTHGRGELVSGSVRVVSDGPIGGMLRFEHPALGVAGVGASPPLSDALFPVRRQEGGITTGVALHNLESSPGLLRCDLMREGVLLDAASIPLEANGQTAWLIDQAFPAADTSHFAGSVRCDAVGEGLFSAVALEMDPGNRIFTTLPVVPVPEMPSQK